MKNNRVSKASGTAIVLTMKGRLALAARVLAEAQKFPRTARQKSLCRQAMRYLSPVVQD